MILHRYHQETKPRFNTYLEQPSPLDSSYSITCKRAGCPSYVLFDSCADITGLLFHSCRTLAIPQNNPTSAQNSLKHMTSGHLIIFSNFVVHCHDMQDIYIWIFQPIIFTYYIWYTNKIQKHTFVVSISENRLHSDALAGVIDNQCLLIKII